MFTDKSKTNSIIWIIQSSFHKVMSQMGKYFSNNSPIVVLLEIVPQNKKTHVEYIYVGSEVVNVVFFCGITFNTIKYCPNKNTFNHHSPKQREIRHLGYP